MKYLSFIVFGFFVSSINAEVLRPTISANDVTQLRTFTSHHGVANVANNAVAYIKNMPNACKDGVYLNLSENDATYSSILAAVMADKSMVLVYDTEKKSPWGDPNFCALLGLGVLN